MNKSLLSKVKTYLNNQKSKSRRYKIFIGLAMIVVFCTVYALMMPAITMGETLICTEEEHVHTEECYEEKLMCEVNSDNIYDESCYEKTLTCEHEEHTHTSDCYVTDTELESINNLISTIDSLPTVEELNNKVIELKSSSEEEANIYQEDIVSKAQSAYNTYNKMSKKEKVQITNIEKLLEYKDANLIEEIDTSEANLLTTYQSYSISSRAINTELTTVNAASTKEFIELNLYDYGSNINTNYKSDNKYPGFQWNGGAYLKSTYDRHKVDYIDFGNSMITDFTYGSSYSTSNPKSPNAQDIAKSDGSNGAINKIDVSDYGVTNRPIGISLNSSIISKDADVLSRTLGSDGYPALKDGTSLAYLFKDGTYADIQNTSSIDGLFQQNTITGEYYYNSRENHAQYSNNQFTLYNQIITPNFITYPFGNFLPLDDITNGDTATKVGGITNINTYVQGVINDLVYSSDYSSNPTKKQLVDMLAKYRDDLKTVSTTGGNAWTTWSAKNAIVDYFTTTADKADNPTDNTSLITNTLLNKMYNIDWSSETNFFFGMEMKMNFLQPKGGMTGNDTNKDGESDYPMEFYFTGDDDVWVYIDNVLFLDLSGIHRHVGGKIDFVNGKVYYYYLDTENTGDVSSTPYQTYTFEEILSAAGKSTTNLNSNGTFKDYTTHSFKFYYMERGSGSSVCRLNFNFPLLRQNTISVSKELSVDVENSDFLGNPDFKFQVLKADSSGNKTSELFIAANTTYTIYDENNNKVGTGTTDDNGVFVLKAGQRAEFTGIKENAGKYYVRELLDESIYEQYGKITVSGESTTKSEDVTVGSDTFTGVDSPVKNMSDGSTIFAFNNNITTNKYGSLRITKVLEGYKTTDVTKIFKFKITLDGSQLPSGTTYTVIKTDGTKEDRTVTEIDTGVLGIVLSSGETAIIEKILAGSVYEVTELTSGINGYVIKYNGKETSSITGSILANSAVEITVTNTEKGTDIIIPITKIISNPDGYSHTYEFELTEVTNYTGDNPVLNGVSQTITLNVTDTITIGEAFKLKFARVDYEDLTSEHTYYYYRIKEVTTTDTTTSYDDSIYVIKVEVTNTDELFTTKVINVYKDGNEITEIQDDKVVNKIEFTNQLITDLTISKEVKADDTSGKFNFEIKLIYNEKPITGSYKYTKGVETEIKYLTFNEEGITNIELSHNESITIYGIPYNTKYTIEELNTDGYIVKYSIDSNNIQIGNIVTSDLKTGNNQVDFINITGYELPATGSSGMLNLIIIGSLLLIVPVIYIGYIICKRERKVS